MRDNLRKYPGKSKVKTITITDWKQMVRTITYAMYVQNSIFRSFLKNEKIISSLFDIVFLCRYRLFRYFAFLTSP